MKRYRAVFYNKMQFVGYMEWNAKHLTKERFRQVIGELFFWAAQSYEYKNMKAVIERNGKEIMTIICETITDGSTIISYLFSKGQVFRQMVVAA